MKTIKYLLLVFLLVILVGCKDKAFMEQYPQLTDKKHIYEVIDATKVLDLIEQKKTALIIFGFKECPWCQAIVPYANEVGKEMGLKTIYYCDIKDMRDNSESVDHEKYLRIKEYFIEAIDIEKDRLNAPTTIALKDGKMVGYHLDTVSSHLMEDNILPPLNTTQEEELRIILQGLIKKIK